MAPRLTRARIWLACTAMVAMLAGAQTGFAQSIAQPITPKNIKPFETKNVLGKKTFIDFEKLGAKSPFKDLGKVKFESKPLSSTGATPKKAGKPDKADTLIDFRNVTVSGSDGTVDIEMVSLSLTSVNQVSLQSFGRTGTGRVTLSLVPTKKSKGKGNIKIPGGASNALQKKFSKNIDAFLKLTDDANNKKPILREERVQSDGSIKKVPLALNLVTPPSQLVQVADQSAFHAASDFCVQAPGATQGQLAAQICLSPLSIQTPEPATFTIMGFGLASVALVGAGWRRRRDSMPMAAAA